MPASLPEASVRSLQGRAAAARRWKSEDELPLRRDYAAEKIAAYVQKIVAEAPPLTANQRARIAALLGGSA